MTVNAIGPGALTRLTGDLEMTDEIRRNFAPTWVAPVITWLASPDSADITGQVIEASGLVLAVARAGTAARRPSRSSRPRRSARSSASWWPTPGPRTLFNEVS